MLFVRTFQITTDYLDETKSSSLNVQDSTPVYIIKASEVYFLRAEGALVDGI